jgi:hypothetical protein
VSFRYLHEGKLKYNETKDYASKNILLNVHSLFYKIVSTLSKEGLLDSSEKEGMKKFEYDLQDLIDNNLKHVLINLMSYYPQPPPTGATFRIKEALIEMDRT